MRWKVERKGLKSEIKRSKGLINGQGKSGIQRQRSHKFAFWNSLLLIKRHLFLTRFTAGFPFSIILCATFISAFSSIIRSLARLKIYGSCYLLNIPLPIYHFFSKISCHMFFPLTFDCFHSCTHLQLILTEISSTFLIGLK